MQALGLIVLQAGARLPGHGGNSRHFFNRVNQMVELFCQVEILFRQAAGIVSGEGESDLVPTNVNVGMVTRFFSKPGDAVHKFDRGREIFELKRPSDGRALLPPFRHGSERGFNMSSIQLFHQ